MQAKGAILNQQDGPIFYRELAPFCSGIDTRHQMLFRSPVGGYFS